MVGRTGFSFSPSHRLLCSGRRVSSSLLLVNSFSLSTVLFLPMVLSLFCIVLPSPPSPAALIVSLFYRWCRVAVCLAVSSPTTSFLSLPGVFSLFVQRLHCAVTVHSTTLFTLFVLTGGVLPCRVWCSLWLVGCLSFAECSILPTHPVLCLPRPLYTLLHETLIGFTRRFYVLALLCGFTFLPFHVGLLSCTRKPS